MTLTNDVFPVGALMVIVFVVVIFVIDAVSWLPRHLVLLLEPSPGVSEPRRHLGQRHLGDNGQHNLLALSRVRVLLVLVEPRLERAGGFSGRVLPSCSIEVHTVSVTRKV